MNRLNLLLTKYNYLKRERAFKKNPIVTLARLFLWPIRCHLHRQIKVGLKPDIALELPAQRRGVARIIYAFRNNYDPQLVWLRSKLSPGMVFVDGGAALGIYSITASKYVGQSGKVIAFEPSRRTFDLLKRNVCVNNCGNVILQNKALSDSEGKGKLWNCRVDLGRNSLIRHDERLMQEFEEIETCRLDTALDDLNIQKVDVIKLDLEGAELPALMGLPKALSSNPIVIFECNAYNTEEGRANAHEIFELLKNIGYDLYELNSLTLRLVKTDRPSTNDIIAARSPFSPLFP